jgi:hypothetical protein
MPAPEGEGRWRKSANTLPLTLLDLNLLGFALNASCKEDFAILQSGTGKGKPDNRTRRSKTENKMELISR